jgi:integrase
LWKLDAQEPAFLDEPDVRRLLELLQDEPIHWRAVITFDLFSGLRRAEILGLRWIDVDIDNYLFHIRQTWNYVPGKGCYIDKPKSRSSARPLKVSQTAILLLLEYKRWQDNQREIMGDAWADTDNRVFTREDGHPFFPDSLTHWFHEFVQRNNLPDVHVHSLRHTYASLQIADGTPLVIVAHNLGHAKPSTTNNIYAHVIASAEAKSAVVMDRFADIVTNSGTKVAPNAKSRTSAG